MSRNTLIFIAIAALAGCESRDQPIVPDQVPAQSRSLTNVAPRDLAAPAVTDPDTAEPNPADTADTAPPAAGVENGTESGAEPGQSASEAQPSNVVVVPYVAPFSGRGTPAPATSGATRSK